MRRTLQGFTNAQILTAIVTELVKGLWVAFLAGSAIDGLVGRGAYEQEAVDVLVDAIREAA